MITIAESFHCIDIGGTVVYVDAEVRKEVEDFLRAAGNSPAILLVESLMGEEVTVIARSVVGMWSSTPETRGAQREYSKLFKEETPISERDE